MAEFIVVDTDILIDVGRGVEKAVEYLQDLEDRGRLAISVVTEMELIVGCRDKSELQELERFLRRFRILPVMSL